MTFTLKQIHDRCEEVGDCLLWKQSCTPNGYPRISEGYAHIAAWQCVHGAVPDRLMVRRICDQKRCCNVDHMVLITRRQQNRIAAKQGAWKSPGRIASITVAARARGKLDELKVAEIRASDLPGTELAKQFGVTKSLISAVRRGKAWAATARGASVFSLGAQP